MSQGKEKKDGYVCLFVFSFVQGEGYWCLQILVEFMCEKFCSEYIYISFKFVITTIYIREPYLQIVYI